MKLPLIAPLVLTISSSILHCSAQLVGPVGPTTSLTQKTHICNILDYGAIADNVTDISSALHAAFDNCVQRNQGSRLYVPTGNYLLKQSVVLSNATSWALQLDGLITAAYDGDWNVGRELILQGFAGRQKLGELIDGEGDKKFLLDVLVIVNGMFPTSALRRVNADAVSFFLVAVDFEFYSSNGLGAIQGQGYLYRNMNKLVMSVLFSSDY